MLFKGDFRKLPSKAMPALNMRADNTCPLIIIKATGECLYANQPADKDEIVKGFDGSKDILLYAWLGQKKSDVFQVTKENLDVHYYPHAMPGAMPIAKAFDGGVVLPPAPKPKKELPF